MKDTSGKVVTLRAGGNTQTAVDPRMIPVMTARTQTKKSG
jgi:hypothetical protein